MQAMQRNPTLVLPSQQKLQQIRFSAETGLSETLLEPGNVLLRVFFYQHYLQFWPAVGHVWKSRGGIMVNGVFPRDSIHHDTSKAFPHIFILLSSWSSKEGFLSANGLPREYHGQCLQLKVQTLVEANPDILFRDVEIMMQLLFLLPRPI